MFWWGLFCGWLHRVRGRVRWCPLKRPFQPYLPRAYPCGPVRQCRTESAQYSVLLGPGMAMLSRGADPWSAARFMTAEWWLLLTLSFLPRQNGRGLGAQDVLLPHIF